MDGDRFNRQMARNGKKALVMTAVLAIVLIGPLVAGALWVIGSQPPAPSSVSVPPVVTAMSLSEYLWIIVPSAILAVICWVMMYTGQDRYWGKK